MWSDMLAFTWAQGLGGASPKINLPPLGPGPLRASLEVCSPGLGLKSSPYPTRSEMYRSG